MRRSRCRSPTATPRRPASRWWRSSTTWSACCTRPWASTTPMWTARRSSSSAPPARWTRAGAAPSSTGSTPPMSRASRSAITSNGTTSPAASRACRTPSPAPTRAMMTEPQGPIYMCYDAWLQEQPLTAEIEMPSYGDAKAPVPMAADPAALATVADRLLAAKFPVLLAEYVGRTAHGFDNLVALAETVGAAVYDVNGRLNFPNRHKLNLSMEKSVFGDADLILSLDTRDWEKPTHRIDRTKRRTRAALSRRLRDDRDRLRRHRAFANGRWTTRGCPIAACACSATPRPRFPSSPGCAARRSPAPAASPSASPSAPPTSQGATTRCSPAGRRSRARTGMPRRSRCRASPMKCGT